MDDIHESSIPPLQLRSHLEHCFGRECDIDPMILRVRLLRARGARRLALCLEQELLPLF